MRVELDAAVRRYEGGRVMVGGSPPTLMRLSATGAATLDALVAGADVDQRDAGPQRRAFVDHLIDAAMMHRVPGRGGPVAPGHSEVSIVVPVHDRPRELDRCLTAIRAHSGSVSAVLVIDDASLDGPAHAEVTRRHGARYLRLETNRGPAGARNRGLAEVTTPLVAFVDSDIEVSAGWLEPLLAVLGPGDAVLVAPRIVAPEHPVKVVARYEASNSPLDMGSRRGRVAPRSRLAYVPAATLVARVDALRVVDGFDASLLVGEDVDMIWRLAAAGQRCRYEPSSTVIHHHRCTVRAMLGRRVLYGTSAALLDRRYRGAVAPVRITPSAATTVAAVVFGRPTAAAATVVVGWARLTRRIAKLRRPGRTAAILVARRQASSWRQLVRALVRPWWPITVVVAVTRPAMRRPLLGGILATVALEYHHHRPRLDPVRWSLLWLADDVAYSLGVWRGCASERRLGPLLPADGRK